MLLTRLVENNGMNQNEFVQRVTPFKDKIFRLAKRLLLSKAEAEDADAADLEDYEERVLIHGIVMKIHRMSAPLYCNQSLQQQRSP